MSREAAPKTKCDTVVRVRIFALAADGRRSLDPIGESEDACDLDARALQTLAASLADAAVEDVDPHPRRVRVEVSVSKGGGKGAPKALNRDCPWLKLGACAGDLAYSCAIRLQATPPKAPPGTELLDGALDGALDAVDLVEQAQDGIQLIKSMATEGGPDDQGLERIGELLEDPRVLALLDRLEKKSKIPVKTG